jgi:hypothetical protein
LPPSSPNLKKPDPKSHTSETLADEIDELMGEIEGLRAAYEQYFLGVERRPPTERHDRLKKRVNAIQTTTVKQTAAKFRAQTLNAKLLTYERLWQRTLQEIEDGTYRRDLFKAKLHRKEPEAAKPPPPPAEALQKAGVPAVAPVAAKAPSPSSPGPKPSVPVAAASAPAGQLSDTKLRAIYDAYVTAKKRCNEDVSKLSYDTVATTLRQQVPALMKQHNVKSVEFKVVIKDGRAILRALPKE